MNAWNVEARGRSRFIAYSLTAKWRWRRPSILWFIHEEDKKTYLTFFNNDLLWIPDCRTSQSRGLNSSSQTPLLMFCEALIAADLCPQLDVALTIDLVEAALAEGRLDLISVWLSSQHNDRYVVFGSVYPPKTIALLKLSDRPRWRDNLK